MHRHRSRGATWAPSRRGDGQYGLSVYQDRGQNIHECIGIGHVGPRGHPAGGVTVTGLHGPGIIWPERVSGQRTVPHPAGSAWWLCLRLSSDPVGLLWQPRSRTITRVEGRR